MYDFLLVVFWGCGQTPPVLCARNCLRMPKIFPCSPLCTFFQRLGCFLHSFCVENRIFFAPMKPVCCFFRESASPWQGLSGIELRAWLIVAARPAWDSLRSLTHLFFVLVLLGAANETKSKKENTSQTEEIFVISHKRFQAPMLSHRGLL